MPDLLTVGTVALVIVFCCTPIWLDWCEKAFDRLFDVPDGDDEPHHNGSHISQIGEGNGR